MYSLNKGTCTDPTPVLQNHSHRDPIEIASNANMIHTSHFHYVVNVVCVCVVLCVCVCVCVRVCVVCVYKAEKHMTWHMTDT